MQDSILDEDIIPLKRTTAPKLYPSWGRRFWAFFIDVVATLSIVGLVSFIVIAMALNEYFFYPFLLCIPLYRCWAEAKFGATLGKRAMGIVVVTVKEQHHIGWYISLKRNILVWGYFLLLICLYYLQTMVGNSPASRPIYGTLILSLEEFLLVYVIGYFLGAFFLFFSLTFRTLYDYWAGTVCVNQAFLLQEK